MAPNANVEVSAALPHLQIVDRLVELPLVNSAWGYANQRYAQLKSSSQLVNNTLDRAEGVFQLAVTTVTPVINKIEQPIHYADNLAVQGLTYVEQKYDSIQKSGGELKDSTLKVVDQTKERFQAVKTSTIQTVQSKVQSVLTLPSNVVPVLDQILTAGENVLDYLLPEGANKGEGKQNGSVKPQEVGDQQDPKTVLRLIIVRMRAFSDKVQKRIVAYSQERWIPALFGSVVVIKDNLEKFVTNGAAGKLLANGHSSTAPTETSNAAAAASSTTTTSQSASTKPSNTKKNASSNATSNSSNSSAPNGDAKKSTENESGASS